MTEFDAFAGGITYGGLRNMMEIRLLVCYILSAVAEPMTRRQLCESVTETGLVNFFDVNEAIDELIKHNAVKLEGTGDEAKLTATVLGKNAASELEKTLLPTTRERAVRAALRQVTRSHAERETTAEITQTATGYQVHFAIHAGADAMLSLTLYAADRLQAEQMKEGFLNDPAALYTAIVEQLT